MLGKIALVLTVLVAMAAESKILVIGNCEAIDNEKACTNHPTCTWCLLDGKMDRCYYNNGACEEIGGTPVLRTEVKHDLEKHMPNLLFIIGSLAIIIITYCFCM